MKTLLRILVLSVLLPAAARAQFAQTITNLTLKGASNNILSGATFTVTSGATLIFGGGSQNTLLAVTGTGGQVGTIGLGAGLSISGGNLTAGSSSSHNPTAVVGTTVVNGVASTFMTSDSAPPIDLTMVPTWTGLHTFSPTAVKTSGTDYGILLTPTLNQRNATNFILIFGNETITQAGTGNQYLMELQVGAADKWVVDSTGTVTTGTWQGAAIGNVYGGTGLTSFTQGALLTATANNVWGQLAAGTINFVLISNGAGLVPGWQTLTTFFDSIAYPVTPAQGVILERGITAWQTIAPSTTGTVLMSNGATSDPSYQFPLSQLLTTTGDLIYSSSGTTPGRLGIGSSGQVLTVSGGLPSWAAFSALTNPMTTLYDIIYGGISGNPTRLPIGANNTFLGINGSGVLGYYAVAGTSAANPTAAVGTAAVNGSASTFMRSDGAPAIDLTMAPTWSGQHTFASSSGTGLKISHAAGNLADISYIDTTGTWSVGIGRLNTGSFDVEYLTTGQSVLSASAATGAITFYSATISSSNVTGGAIFGGGIGVAKTSWMASLNLVPVANSSGVAPYFSIQMPNDTGLTASTEVPGFHLITGTRKWATTGTVATQREVLFEAPTYGSASASQTFTKAATVAITGAPIAGTNGIITNAYALWVQAGLTELDGTLATTGLFTKYNNIATAGWGIQAIPGYGRQTGQVAADTTVAAYTPAADGDFVVSANVNVTTYVSGTFTVTCTYTDEAGSSRIAVMNFQVIAGTISTAIAAGGAFEGIPLHIRAKGTNAITVATTGTFTSLTYNVDAAVTEVD